MLGFLNKKSKSIFTKLQFPLVHFAKMVHASCLCERKTTNNLPELNEWNLRMMGFQVRNLCFPFGAIFRSTMLNFGRVCSPSPPFCFRIFPSGPKMRHQQESKRLISKKNNKQKKKHLKNPNKSFSFLMYVYIYIVYIYIYELDPPSYKKSASKKTGAIDPPTPNGLSLYLSGPGVCGSPCTKK